MQIRYRNHINLIIILILCALSPAQSQINALFTAASNQGCSPFITSFTDQSTGNVTGWEWNFGNGSTSFLQNPSTSYILPGNYTVTLIVSNSTETDTLVFNNYITVFSNPEANLQAAPPTVGCVPFTVDFADLSVPADGAINQWLWDFGDGTVSPQSNPSHTFYLDGTFTISLEIEDVNGCKDFTSVTNLISTTDPPEVEFIASQTFACAAPILVTFANQTTGNGPMTYLWQFGDGDTSTAENPTHNYTMQGTFDVTLTAIDINNCSDTLEKFTYITIQNYVADFDVETNRGCLMPHIDTFEFTDLSAPFTNTYSWDFGDGTTSNLPNPDHAYDSAGIYIVTLTSGNIFCSGTIQDTIYVQQLSAVYDVDTFFSCNPPATFHFTDLSFNASSWIWRFNDGDTSHAPNPSHTYNYDGTFDVELYVQNEAGCEDTARGIKIVVDQLNAEIAFDTISGCIPVNVNLFDMSIGPANAISWTWSLDDSIVGNLPTFSTTLLDTGAFNMELIVVDSLGCTDTADIMVSAGVKPTGYYTTTSDTICAGANAIFYVTSDIANNYLWFFGNGDSSFGFANPNYHAYEDTGLFFTSFIPFHFGCPGDTFTPDTGIYASGPIAAGSVIPNCDNVFEFQFLDQSIAVTDYYWDFGDGDTSILSNVTHIYTVKAQYDITHVVYNSNSGCVDSISLDVNITNPEAIFTISDTIGCKRLDNVYFDGSMAIDGQWGNNFWNFGNGTFYPDTNTVDSAQLVSPDFIDYDTAGIYTVLFRVTDVNGCVDSAFRQIRIYEHQTDFEITWIDSCLPVDVLLTDSSSADTTITSWHWDFDDGDSALTQNTSHLYSDPGEYNLVLTTTDAIGCSDQKEFAIEATDPQAFFVNTTPQGCIGDFMIFSNLSTGFGLTYQWNFGDGTGSVSQHPIKFYSYSDSFTVQLVITDYNGCKDTFIREKYVVIREPVAGFLISDTFSPCPPLLVSFTDLSQYHITSWMWDLGDSTFSADPNPQHNYTEPGTYDVILSLEDDLGCTSTDTFPEAIHIGGPSGNAFLTPDSGCSPLSVNFWVEDIVDVQTVIWDFGDGNVSTGDSVTHVYDSTGIFTPIVVLSNGLSGQQLCDVVEVLDPIYINPVKADFTLSAYQACLPAEITISNESSNAIQWDWNFNNDSSSNAQNPANLNFNSAEVYSITLQVMSDYGCTDETTKTLALYDLPVVAVSGAAAVCEGEEIQLMASYDPGYSYRWFPSSGLNDDGIFNPIATPNNTTFYSVEVTDANGCAAVSDTLKVQIQSSIQLEAWQDTTIFIGELARLIAITDQPVNTYSWQPSATLSCNDCISPIVNTVMTQTYYVTTIDTNGCFEVADEVTVTLKDDIKVSMPEAFTPNGDGINDVIFVGGYGIKELLEFSIYNRWGELVFRSSDLSIGWDGMYKGAIQNIDSYVYYIRALSFSDKTREKKGSFSLLK